MENLLCMSDPCETYVRWAKDQAQCTNILMKQFLQGNVPLGTYFFACNKLQACSKTPACSKAQACGKAQACNTGLW